MSRRTLYAIASASLVLIILGAVLDATLDDGGHLFGTVLWIIGCVGVVVGVIGGAFGGTRQNR